LHGDFDVAFSVYSGSISAFRGGLFWTPSTVAISIAITAPAARGTLFFFEIFGSFADAHGPTPDLRGAMPTATEVGPVAETGLPIGSVPLRGVRTLHAAT